MLTRKKQKVQPEKTEKIERNRIGNRDSAGCNRIAVGCWVYRDKGVVEFVFNHLFI